MRINRGNALLGLQGITFLLLAMGIDHPLKVHYWLFQPHACFSPVKQPIFLLLSRPATTGQALKPLKSITKWRTDSVIPIGQCRPVSVFCLSGNCPKYWWIGSENANSRTHGWKWLLRQHIVQLVLKASPFGYHTKDMKPLWHLVWLSFRNVVFTHNTYKPMQQLMSGCQRVVKSGYKWASVATFTSPTEYGQRNDKRSLLFQGLQWDC